MDSTVVVRCGLKQAAGRGYNPKKRARLTNPYCPCLGMRSRSSGVAHGAKAEAWLAEPAVADQAQGRELRTASGDCGDATVSRRTRSRAGAWPSRGAFGSGARPPIVPRSKCKRSSPPRGRGGEDAIRRLACGARGCAIAAVAPREGRENRQRHGGAGSALPVSDDGSFTSVGSAFASLPARAGVRTSGPCERA